MKKLFYSLIVGLLVALPAVAAKAPNPSFHREIPVRQHGKEAGMLLDLGKISLGTLNNVEEKKQYLSTVQLEKQRIQNYTLRMVYDNAYQLYKMGDYQRAQEMAQTILSIDPNFTQAQTLARQAQHMGTYGTTSEGQVIEAKFQEASHLYDSGRLVEANDKLNEILTIQPGNSKAQSWKRKIDYEIAQEYARRGDEYNENGNYQEALNNWYNALLMRKDDPRLVSKIAEAENKVRKEQVEDYMRQAMNFYNKGQYVESYVMFERITKIQPGDPRVQKYMSQLKNEIAAGYYNAGGRSYNAGRFDQAVTYWTNAKKWGADSATIDSLIKRARNAKETGIRQQQQEAALAVKKAEEAIKKAEEAAKKAEEAKEAKENAGEEKDEFDDDDPLLDTIMPVGNVPGMTSVVPGTSSTTTTTTTSTSIGKSTTPGAAVDPNETLPTMGGTMARVSPEAQAASRAKFYEGLEAYNQDDYERAKAAWIVAKQLDPGNREATTGLLRIEEMLK